MCITAHEITQSVQLSSTCFQSRKQLLTKFTIDEAKVGLSVRVCACVSVCVSLASDSSETINVIIIKRGTMTASDMIMHHVFIIWIILGYIDLNHENNQCLHYFRNCSSNAHQVCSEDSPTV